MVKIVDVAAHAGVSTATVSRVLNGTKVRPDLTEAVRRAIRDLDYVPNRTARSLRRRHSDVIALVIPDVENPFFTSVARGVEDVAHAAGLSVVLCNTDDDAAKEQRYLTVAEHENMAGVILAPAGPAPSLERLLQRGRAVVVIDREVPGAVDHILFDNRELGRRGAQALIARGHTDIACITGPRTTTTAVDRAAGWREALHRHGLPATRLHHANFRTDGGHSAMLEILASGSPPHAILATNNLVGVGALQALSTWTGANVDVGVIGDLPFATSDVEDLAQISLNPRDMGMAAAERLVARLQAPGPLDRVIDFCNASAILPVPTNPKVKP